MKHLIPFLLTAALLVSAATLTPAAAQEKTPSPVPYGLALLDSQDAELVRIVSHGAGPGSPEQKEAIRAYHAIQRFLQMVQTRGNEGRFRIASNGDGSMEAFDTKTSRTLLKSKDGKLTAYDPSLVQENGENQKKQNR